QVCNGRLLVATVLVAARDGGVPRKLDVIGPALPAVHDGGGQFRIGNPVGRQYCLRSQQPVQRVARRPARIGVAVLRKQVAVAFGQAAHVQGDFAGLRQVRLECRRSRRRSRGRLVRDRAVDVPVGIGRDLRSNRVGGLRLAILHTHQQQREQRCHQGENDGSAQSLCRQ